MNFLAHLYLSGDDPEVRLGNFIGDFVKGRNPGERFPEKLTRGILLHRRIDAFTDMHASVRTSKKLLTAGHRHYSGVILDIFFDHFLAEQWPLHHPQPLEEFAMEFYRYAQSRQNDLPERAGWVLKHMIEGDWLSSYRTIGGIDRVLKGMARRTSFPSGMERASESLELHYDFFGQEFAKLFHDLKKECASADR